jgi:cytoskeleton protein RodZ
VTPQSAVVAKRPEIAATFLDTRLLSNRRMSSRQLAVIVVLAVIAGGVIAKKMSWLPAGLASVTDKIESGWASLHASFAKNGNSMSAASTANTPASTAGRSDSTQETLPVPALPAVVASAASDAPASADALVLVAREDSWVEIKRGKEVVLSRVLRAGTNEKTELSGPVTLTIGNATGVDVTLRGTPVDTKSDSRNNVARLNLK